MRLRRFIGIVLAVLIVALGVESARAAPVKASDQTDIAQVEHYLNSVDTLKARFIQMSANGSYAEGDLYLSRPGRMRLNYDAPNEIEIIADGHVLIYHDRKLEQVSYIGLDSSPAGIMLRPKVRLGGDTTVTGVQRIPGALEISMVQTSDPAAGELTLLFSANPLALKQWRVRDAQGQVVTVSLFDAVRGEALDPKLFEFVDPNFSKPSGQ